MSIRKAFKKACVKTCNSVTVVAVSFGAAVGAAGYGGYELLNKEPSTSPNPMAVTAAPSDMRDLKSRVEGIEAQIRSVRAARIDRYSLSEEKFKSRYEYLGAVQQHENQEQREKYALENRLKEFEGYVMVAFWTMSAPCRSPT
jgi:hypothetical protein